MKMNETRKKNEHLALKRGVIRLLSLIVRIWIWNFLFALGHSNSFSHFHFLFFCFFPNIFISFCALFSIGIAMHKPVTSNLLTLITFRIKCTTHIFSLCVCTESETESRAWLFHYVFLHLKSFYNIICVYWVWDMGSTDTIRYFIVSFFCIVAVHAAAAALHGKSRIYIMIIII